MMGMLAGVIGYGVALLFHLTSPGTTPLAATLAGALVAVPGRFTAEAPGVTVWSKWWRSFATSRASTVARASEAGVLQRAGAALAILRQWRRFHCARRSMTRRVVASPTRTRNSTSSPTFDRGIQRRGNCGPRLRGSCVVR